MSRKELHIYETENGVVVNDKNKDFGRCEASAWVFNSFSDAGQFVRDYFKSDVYEQDIVDSEQ